MFSYFVHPHTNSFVWFTFWQGETQNNSVGLLKLRKLYRIPYFDNVLHIFFGWIVNLHEFNSRFVSQISRKKGSFTDTRISKHHNVHFLRSLHFIVPNMSIRDPLVISYKFDRICANFAFKNTMRCMCFVPSTYSILYHLKQFRLLLYTFVYHVVNFASRPQRPPHLPFHLLI